ncbi:plasmid stabilization system protein [Methanoculleus bourgensis MS2]|jgi:mRNA interferase RelE/StbE|uniref:Plasmid stabilization system protein n=1 Tax=Methanoculleus bourgensis (strain ATCC 43281 / DSM 3045 / OCM 15 / MS2) TaxID=1201294 RepID=I7LL06_METBM|nr:type II toxin-antitoxin system RelE/ParE family toxin [Methanoculleus bourgensis]CCJ37507.1 plasmid stabilization system protein [Methanoculleus bourgensis MS2]
MIWRLIITPTAERDIDRIPDPDAKRIKEELYALADEPYPRFYVKKLKGHPKSPLYSLRVGQYRVILAIENNVMVITVIEVGNRSNVYRKY